MKAIATQRPETRNARRTDTSNTRCKKSEIAVSEMELRMVNKTLNGFVFTERRSSL